MLHIMKCTKHTKESHFRTEKKNEKRLLFGLPPPYFLRAENKVDNKIYAWMEPHMQNRGASLLFHCQTCVRNMLCTCTFICNCTAQTNALKHTPPLNDTKCMRCCAKENPAEQGVNNLFNKKTTTAQAPNPNRRPTSSSGDLQHPPENPASVGRIRTMYEAQRWAQLQNGVFPVDVCMHVCPIGLHWGESGAASSLGISIRTLGERMWLLHLPPAALPL